MIAQRNAGDLCTAGMTDGVDDGRGHRDGCQLPHALGSTGSPWIVASFRYVGVNPRHVRHLGNSVVQQVGGHRAPRPRINFEFLEQGGAYTLRYATLNLSSLDRKSVV